MNADAPGTTPTPPAESHTQDPIRWFEETLNAWVASGEAIGDPWRLQELAHDAAECSDQEGAAATLLIEAIAGEAQHHLSPTLQTRFREALEGFVAIMEHGESPSSAPSHTTPSSGTDPDHFEARLELEVERRLAEQAAEVTPLDVSGRRELERTREAVERGLRRLRLAEEAATSQRASWEIAAERWRALEGEHRWLVDAYDRSSRALEQTRGCLELARPCVERGAQPDPANAIELLDELACEIHLARMAASAEVARRGATSEIAPIAAVLRRLDDQVRRLCARHADRKSEDTLDACNHALGELDRALELAETEPLVAGPPTPETSEPDDDFERLRQGAERLAGLIGDGLSCCDQALAPESDPEATEKSPRTSPPPTSPV